MTQAFNLGLLANNVNSSGKLDGATGLTTSVVANTIGSAASTALTLQSAGTTAITVDTSQNVGVGTASPTTQLSIYKGSQGNNLNVRSRTYLGGTTSSDSLVLGYSVKADTGATDQMVGTETNSGGGAPAAILMNSGVMQFHTASSVTSGSAFSSERMRIDSSGNLLVGCTSLPGGGTTGTAFQLGASISGMCTWTNRSNSTAASDHAYFYNPNSIVGFIRTTGSATAYSTSSDYRLKENITPMTGALAKVALLKPVTYKWKVDGSDGEGFIAHELAEVKPDCVSGEKDAVDADGKPVYQGIDTSFLVATLTAALQETKALIDTQATTINALTARIVALEKK